MTDQLVMKAGQWLTHDNGEHYARAIRDIHYHSVIMSSDFEMTHGGHPIAGEEIPTDVIKLGPHGKVSQVCIDGQWKFLCPTVIEPSSDEVVSEPSDTGVNHD
jgi:hypothetical protein